MSIKRLNLFTSGGGLPVDRWALTELYCRASSIAGGIDWIVASGTADNVELLVIRRLSLAGEQTMESQACKRITEDGRTSDRNQQEIDRRGIDTEILKDRGIKQEIDEI